MDKLDIDKLYQVIIGNIPSNLSNFKSTQINVDILVPVPVKIKNTEDKIPDIISLATNASLNAKINEVKCEIPRITNLATNSALNAKINEVKCEITSITNLVLLLLLLLLLKIKYLMLVISQKTDYNTKINEIEKKITDHDRDKYITTPEFNKLTSGYFAARLAQANLASKSDIANFVKKTDFDDK